MIQMIFAYKMINVFDVRDSSASNNLTFLNYCKLYLRNKIQIFTAWDSLKQLI